MLFLAEMPAVVGPQHDDGVVGLAAFVERTEHAAHLRVSEGGRGEITVHCFAPLRVFEYLRVVALRPGHLHAGGRDVVEIVVRHIWQGQFFGVEQVVIFLRHIPRQVWFVDTAREEERLVVFEAKLSDHPVGDLVVAHFFVRHIERCPVKLRRLGDAVDRSLGWLRIVRLVLGRAGPVSIPRRRIGKRAVINLTRTAGPVAVLHEMLRQRHGIRHGGAPRLAVQVHAGSRGQDTAHQRRA